MSTQKSSFILFNCYNNQILRVIYKFAISEYLKYKVLSREAKSECEVKENATLWEVLHGGNEWDAIYQSLDEDTRRGGIWINAKALETCSEHLGKDYSVE